MTDIEKTNVIPEPENNPLLARVEMPGSTFQLPSRGLFYHNNELKDGVLDGEVHIHPMSAYDEILMKTPDALYSGNAVNKVFKRCIPEVLQPNKLLAKDVDFLLVCLRKITYGDEMEIKFTHDCANAKSQSYMVNISQFISKSKKIDPTTVGNIYSTKMDNGQVVKLHPSKFEDVVKMYQDVKMENITPEEELEMTVFVIQSIIESVDGITDKKLIGQWITKISAGWIEHLSDVIDSTSDFGPNFKFETKCKDCNETITIESPINPISFFM